VTRPRAVAAWRSQRRVAASCGGTRACSRERARPGRAGDRRCVSRLTLIGPWIVPYPRTRVAPSTGAQAAAPSARTGSAPTRSATTSTRA
jgi:hypothetical protein